MEHHILSTISLLNEFWSKQLCTIHIPYDIEMGAGTLHPTACFFPVLEQAPMAIALVQPCRRPADSRAAKSHTRMQRFLQYQVLLSPTPTNFIETIMLSLCHLDIKTENYDVRFFKDDWHSPVIGASGMGWEMRLNGIEIAQITYFQTMGGITLAEPVLEITYGIERLSMFVQHIKEISKLHYDPHILYKALTSNYEKDHSKYLQLIGKRARNNLAKIYALWEKEATTLYKHKLFIPSYECVLKMSHLFNIADGAGLLSHTNKAQYILNMRNIANKIAEHIVPANMRGHTAINLPIKLPASILNQKVHSLPKSELYCIMIEIGYEPLASESLKHIDSSMHIEFTSWIKSRFAVANNIETYATYRRCVMQAFVREYNSESYLDLEYDIVSFLHTSLAAVTKNHQHIYLGSQQILPFIVPVRSYNICINNISISLQDYFYKLDNHTSNLMQFVLDYTEPTKTIDDFAKKNITISQKTRVNKIIDDIQHISRAFSIVVPADAMEADLEHIAYSTENPHTLQGVFDVKFLSLPTPLIFHVIRQHIKALPTLTTKGLNSNIFIVITDTIPDQPNNMIKYFEREVNNRLMDISYLLKNDTKIGPKKLLRQLNNIEYAEGCGSYVDKINRMTELHTVLLSFNPHIDEKLPIEDVQTAIKFSKIDIAAQIIQEAPELAGTVASYILKKHRFSHDIADAIKEHYHPRHLLDHAPESLLGGYLGLLDRLDSIITLWLHVENKPSSHGDPHGIKRIGIGIIKIIMKHNLHINLQHTIAAHINRWFGNSINNISTITEELITFLRQRLSYIFTTIYPEHKRVVQACINTPTPFEPIAVATHIHQLCSLSTTERDHLITTYKRCFKLVRKYDAAQLTTIPDDKSVIQILRLAKEIQLFLDTEKINAGTEEEIEHKTQKLIRFIYLVNKIINGSDIIC